MSKHLAHVLRAYCSRWKAVSLAISGFVTLNIFCNGALAHVGLDSPNGGETLSGDSTYVIQWHVEIEHNTMDWDLWYSTESDAGPWEEIAFDLPKGATAENEIHTFDWTVPNIDMPAAWVRVRQDNAGEDYYDVSDASFLVEAMLVGGSDFTGDGSIDGADLDAWQLGYGSTPAAQPDGDADLDNDVDGADFLTWQADYSVTGSTLSALPVPEPTATILLLLGMIVMLWQKRRSNLGDRFQTYYITHPKS